MITFITLFFEWIQGCFNFLIIRLTEKKNSKLLDIWHQCYICFPIIYCVLKILGSIFYSS